MAVLPLVIAPDPRLNTPSVPVEKITDETRALVNDLIETMHATGGIGLAAVQVGVHLRILVMDTDRGSERYEDGAINEEDSNPICMINPEIITESDESNIYEEGCLSFPGQYANVSRPKCVTVRYTDEHNNEHTLECDELAATCVQHEIDHLDGIVFVDHISRIKRDMILRKLRKAKK